MQILCYTNQVDEIVVSLEEKIDWIFYSRVLGAKVQLVVRANNIKILEKEQKKNVKLT